MDRVELIPEGMTRPKAFEEGRAEAFVVIGRIGVVEAVREVLQHPSARLSSDFSTRTTHLGHGTEEESPPRHPRISVSMDHTAAASGLIHSVVAVEARADSVVAEGSVAEER